ncbi:hypothetical protein BX666DRAFT_1983261 [Dichotomocladium elegans]|nr:hypothetical protein BX666DRAFT_1983261 [Dichotomocladium elegans]
MEERWNQFKQVWQKFNVANLLFCYCLPIFYLFYPAWLMPAIFLRTLSFFIGWLYQIVMHHHTGQRGRRQLQRRRQQQQQPGRTNTMQQKPSMSSSSASSDSEDAAVGGLDPWMLKCSICLTRRYNLCLESCRDQFCKACFERYVDEVVQQSWGLGVTRIKCPVCLEPVRQTEWSRYVSAALVERYERFNQPFRPMARSCPSCKASIVPCQSPRSKGTTRQRRLEIISELLQSLGKNPLDLQMPLRINTIQTLSHQLSPFLKQAAMSSDRNVYQRAAMVSKHLVALEGVPESWKQAQFWHVANFPVETWYG